MCYLLYLASTLSLLRLVDSRSLTRPHLAPDTRPHLAPDTRPRLTSDTHLLQKRAFFYAPTDRTREFQNHSARSHSNKSRDPPSSNTDLALSSRPRLTALRRRRSVDQSTPRHSFFFKPPRVRDNKKVRGAAIAPRGKIRVALLSNRSRDSGNVATVDNTFIREVGRTQPSSTNSPHTLTVVYWADQSEKIISVTWLTLTNPGWTSYRLLGRGFRVVKLLFFMFYYCLFILCLFFIYLLCFSWLV